MLDQFPTISYNDSVSVTDISQRVPSIDSSLLLNFFQDQNQRPDTIASQLYGDPFKDWTVVLANQTTDPLNLSVLDDNTFNDLITQAYGDVATAQSQIAFWQNNWQSDKTQITPLQYANLSSSVQQLYDVVKNVYGQVTGYTRKPINLRKSTSLIVDYTVTDCSYPVGQYIQIKQSSLVVGSARIRYKDSTKITVDHVQGNYQGDYISDKITTLSIADISIIDRTINDDEVNFYSPVTIYDYLYEKLVQSRRNIKIIAPSSVTNVIDDITSKF